MHVSMRKVQILFPDPQLRRLREAAKREDRPLSEIIRRAAESYLDRLPTRPSEPRTLRVPVFDGGKTLAEVKDFRELAHWDRTRLP